MSDDRNKDDEFQKRLDRLARKTGQAEESAQEAKSDTGSILSGLKFLGSISRFFQGVGAFGKKVWDNALRPVWNVVAPSLKGISDFYMNRVWTPLAYKKDEDGERTIFSKKGAGTAIALTAAFAMVAGPIMGAAAEGVVMATTMRTETVNVNYLNSHGDGTYSVRGCAEEVKNAEECSAADTVYYNVEPSMARNIWSYATQGTRYLPRKIVGPISYNSTNECEVLIYDAPFEWLWEQFDSYPELLAMTCKGADGSVIQQGQIDGAMNEATLQQDFAAAEQGTVLEGELDVSPVTIQQQQTARAVAAAPVATPG